MLQPKVLPIVLRGPSYPTPLLSTLYVSEWSNFYIIDIEGEEETKAEPDPNLTLELLFASTKVECSGQQY